MRAPVKGLAACLTTALGLCAPPLVAQGAPPSRGVAMSSSVSPRAIARPDTTAVKSGRPAPRREAAVVTYAKPRSVQVVTVPMPESMPRNRRVHYVVTATSTVAILGRKEGLLDARTQADPRVLLTLGIQAAALAGRSTVAEVLFTAADAEPVVVPVELEVSPLHRVTVTTNSQLVLAPPGQETRVFFRLTNTGNAADTVKIRMDAPAGWLVRIPQSSRRLALEMFASTEGVVAITAPSTITGTVPLTLIAEGDGGERGRATVLLEVPPKGGSKTRLAFTPSLGAVLEDVRPENLAVDMRLSGPLWGSVGLDARWARLPAISSPGLTRLGAGSGYQHVSLYGAQWRFDAGTAGATFAELAGINTYGRGAALTYTGQEWRGSTLFARPFTLRVPGRSQPLLAGVNAARTRGSLELFTSITHLDNGLVSGGRLDAFAVGTRTPWSDHGQVRGEMAYRRYDGGQGIGLAGEADRRGAKGDFRVRVAHAPGGATAFAYSSNQFSAFGSRTSWSRVQTNGGTWYSDNSDAQSDRSQRSLGASFSSTLELNDDFSVGASTSSSAHRLRDSSGTGFGGGTMGLGTFGNGRIGPISFGGSATYSRDTRDAEIDSTSLLPDSERRLSWRAQASAASRFGIATFSALASRTLGAQSFLPPQSEMQLIIQDIRVPAVDRVAVLNATITRFDGYGTNPIITQRYDATVTLPGAVLLRLDLERNPLFGSFGRRRWSTAMRVERTFGLPSLSGLRANGYVFQDFDGDGVRDPGEPGLAGVLLRAEGELAVTAKDGRYRLAAAERVVPEIDERSLPYGWVLRSRRPPRGKDFAVIPMSSAEVRLQIVDDEANRLASANLSRAGIVAHDDADRTWVARVDSAGRGLFEALPPGRYRVSFDFSRLVEPLQLRGEEPVFRTTASRETIRLSAPVAPRRLRVWRGGVAGPKTDSVPAAPIDSIVVLPGAPRLTLPVVSAAATHPSPFRGTAPRAPKLAARRGASGPTTMLTTTPAARLSTTRPNVVAKPAVDTVPQTVAKRPLSFWERVVAWTRSVLARLGSMLVSAGNRVADMFGGGAAADR